MKCVNEETERSKTCKSISLNLYFQKTFIVCLLFCYKVFDCRWKWLSSHSLVSRERTFRGLRQTRFAASLSLKTVFAALVDVPAIVGSALPWIWILERMSEEGEFTMKDFTHQEDESIWQWEPSNTYLSLAFNFIYCTHTHTNSPQLSIQDTLFCDTFQNKWNNSLHFCIHH